MDTRGQGIRQTGAIETTVVSSVTTIPSSISTITGSESPGPSSSGSVTKREASVSKKTRTQFTPKQLVYLEECFLNSRFPSAKDREKIAEELGLTTQHIQVWFQNRRAKHRRKSKRKQKIEAVASAVKAPKPPALWPTNLSFNSDLSKDCSTVSKAKAGMSSASLDNNGGRSSQSSDTSVASCSKQLTSAQHSMSSKQSSSNQMSPNVSTSLKSDTLSSVTTTSFQASLSPILATSRHNIASQDHSLAPLMPADQDTMMVEHMLNDIPDLTHSFVDESLVSQVPPTQQHWLHHHYVDQVPNEGLFQDHKPPHSNLYPSPYIETVPTAQGHAQPGQPPFFHSTLIPDPYVPYGHYPAHHCLPTPAVTSPIMMTSSSQEHTASPSITRYHFSSTHYH